ncbi:hypothetical protein KFL_003130080 [Klebsormidium nitens]|uniref:Centromere protein J C-terminal domain-containing protein n=1 Tax=Klebsormidium nitens TaxID=105231 RepID=A0A1Y1IBM0_KLENI|nr:hypothetical protein KFL_003130080 [Klebsormidium nitens]|eukprot:GAQ86819.1 hypothetical protein KFL_003130080 [Klebsormidium nitens]
MLKDHKATLSAILEAAKEQALRHKQASSSSGELPGEQTREDFDAEVIRDLQSEASERTLESGNSESDQTGGQGDGLKQPAVYLRDDIISYRAQLGMASLSSSCTYTPGQLSGGSFPSAFPSPLPIDKDNQQQLPGPSNAVKGNSAGLSSLSQLPFLPTEAFHDFSLGVPSFAPHGVNTPLLAYPQGANAPPLGSWPWLPAGSGVTPSPYEIALMYLQGGGASAPPAAPLPQSGSYELGVHQQFVKSQSGDIYRGQPGLMEPAEPVLQRSAETGPPRLADSGSLRSAEQRGQGSRPGTGASLRSFDEGGRDWELGPAYTEAEPEYAEAAGRKEGGASMFSAAAAVSEFNDVEVRRSRDGVRVREFKGLGAEKASNWEEEDRDLGGVGEPYGQKNSFNKHKAEEKSTAELRGNFFGGGVSEGRDRGRQDPDTIGSFAEQRGPSAGSPIRSHKLVMRNSLDERPLPRASAYSERPSPSKPGASAVIHIPAPSNTPQTLHHDRLSKRPFLKRGSRLLKSVIPRKGEKESWVAEFKGKIAAVPRAVVDVPTEEDTGEGVDWGVLNAQKVTGKRLPPPVSKLKKVVPQKGSRTAVKEEPLVKRGGNFLRAGSRGGRLAPLQNTRPTSSNPVPAARKPAPASELPSFDEIQPVDDLELAEFQALERRLKGHVLEDAEPQIEYEDREKELEPEPNTDRVGVGFGLRSELASWGEGVAGHGCEYENGDGTEEFDGAGEVGDSFGGRDLMQSIDEWGLPEGGESPPGVHYRVEEDERVAQIAEAQPPSSSTQNGRSRFRDSEQWEDDAGFSNGGVEAPAALPPPAAQRQPERVSGQSAEAVVPGRGPPGKGRAAAGVPGESPRVSALVKNVFLGEAKKPALRKGATQSNEPDLAAEMAFLKEKMATLDSEIQRFKRENEKMERARLEYEARADVAAKERATWEKRMQEEEEAWNRKKEAEAQKLKRDKRVLEQQSRALLQLPGRKARGEADELRAQIAGLEEDKRVREARWRLTVDRLKGRVEELTERNKELEEEVKRHEARWLEQWEKQDAPSLKSSKPAKFQGRPQSAAVRSTTAAVSESAPIVPLRQSASRKEETAPVRGVLKSPEKGGIRQSRSDRGMVVRVSGVEGARTGDLGVNGVQERGVNGVQGKNVRRDHTGGVNGASVNGLSSREGNEFGVNGLHEESAKRVDRRGALLDRDDVDALLDEGRKVRNGAFGLETINRGKSSDTFDTGEVVTVHERRVEHSEDFQGRTLGERRVQDSFGTETSTWQDQGGEMAYDSASSGLAAQYRVRSEDYPGLRSGLDGQGENGYGNRDGEKKSVPARGLEVEEASSRGRNGAAERGLEAGLDEGLGNPLEENGAEKEEGDGELLEEIAGAAGKVERVYASGKRVVIFGNGTIKEIHASGKVCIFFTNGDVKNSDADGRVEYYYAEVATWHTTYADGVEVFHFPNGQVEQHEPDGSKEIFFPDGAVRKVNPDGTEEDVAPLD